MRSNYRRHSDWTGVWFLLTILMSFLLTAFGIWAIVEFILYLVKDDPFNRVSLWLTIAAFIGEIVGIFKVITSD